MLKILRPILNLVTLYARCGNAGREVVDGRASTKWSRLLVTSIVKKSHKPRFSSRFAVKTRPPPSAGVPRNQRIITWLLSGLATVAVTITHPRRLPRPQRCGLTRVCSAAAEADVIVVIQEINFKWPQLKTWVTQNVAKSAIGEHVAISSCHASGRGTGRPFFQP